MSSGTLADDAEIRAAYHQLLSDVSVTVQRHRGFTLGVSRVSAGGRGAAQRART